MSAPTKRRRTRREPVTDTVLGHEIIARVQHAREIPRAWPLQVREQHVRALSDGLLVWRVRGDDGREWLLVTNPRDSEAGSRS